MWANKEKKGHEKRELFLFPTLAYNTIKEKDTFKGGLIECGGKNENAKRGTSENMRYYSRSFHNLHSFIHSTNI